MVSAQCVTTQFFPDLCCNLPRCCCITTQSTRSATSPRTLGTTGPLAMSVGRRATTSSWPSRPLNRYVCWSTAQERVNIAVCKHVWSALNCCLFSSRPGRAPHHRPAWPVHAHLRHQTAGGAREEGSEGQTVRTGGLPGRTLQPPLFSISFHSGGETTHYNSASLSFTPWNTFWAPVKSVTHFICLLHWFLCCIPHPHSFTGVWYVWQQMYSFGVSDLFSVSL